MRSSTRSSLARARQGVNPDHEAALALTDETDLEALIETAEEVCDAGHGQLISYSRKVFVPLTHLCRDVCHYCTFARPPRPGERAYLNREEILEIARTGAAAGCKEALFTLGDKPERRYKVAQKELAELGHPSTVSYLAEMAKLVLNETGLLPHANPGVITRDEIEMLRKVTISQGIMLESASERLTERGMAHYGSPDKRPAVRIESMRVAGELQVPFTSGILIGIGETRRERIEALLALRDLHEEFGHIQEIIVQNFRAKPDTKMHDWPEPDLDDLLWTLAVSRVIFGAEMNIQAPPNLSPGVYQRLVAAGLNDWGGVSPVTPDHVNPEAPWPHLEELRDKTADAGKLLVERLAVYPAYNRDISRWQDKAMGLHVWRAIDGEGLARTDDWSPGAPEPPETLVSTTAETPVASAALGAILSKIEAGEELGEGDLVTLFRARGDDVAAVCAAADRLRAEVNGDVVTYVVNRNINYTNVCYFKCQFCAFSKGKLSENLRGMPYDLEIEEVTRRASEAWKRGATEVCMQGGIHPDYTGETYLRLTKAVKEAVPEMHVHAFSPLEIWQGADTLDLPLREYLSQLKGAGLGTLPGTAAEILDDEIRATLCPDKLNTAQWLEVMETAHEVGYQTTATVMYGHIEWPENLARHLIGVRDLQEKTGGFTEFVPLPFVHMEAPLYLKGRARRGPTFREAVLMHAVSRLALHPHITNIQVSWVKMGVKGVQACLNAGCNDMGGTLMNESVSRAAGTQHGQEMPPEKMEAVIQSVGRRPRQRSTTYGSPRGDQVERSFGAEELEPLVMAPAKKFVRRKQSVG